MRLLAMPKGRKSALGFWGWVGLVVFLGTTYYFWIAPIVKPERWVIFEYENPSR